MPLDVRQIVAAAAEPPLDSRTAHKLLSSGGRRSFGMIAAVSLPVHRHLRRRRWT
jgi:hypothetical protein